MKTTISTAPAALMRDDAAAYVGLSISLFEAMVRAGDIPQARQAGKRRVVWLRSELDNYLTALPVSRQAPGPGRKAPQGELTEA